MTAPTTKLPPSYQFEGGINQKSSANVNYMLKFEVNVAGLFTDFEILVPIVLGTFMRLDYS
ncbi:unnamed protein product, partial [Adineta steineri]